MLSLDTTFLVHLWRHRNDESHPVHRFVQQHPGETFVVPVMAAGEFLEGAAYVSEDRLEDAARFLALFQFGEADLETSRSYAPNPAPRRPPWPQRLWIPRLCQDSLTPDRKP